MAQQILVVDDDPHIRQLLVFALAKAGFETREAADGEAALDAVGLTQPDLIVLDINLPRMNGLDVCRRVRAQSAVCHGCGVACEGARLRGLDGLPAGW